MKCIAVGNKKGGVGKTTIAVNIACEMASRDKSVILLDLDEQKSATDWAKSGKLPIQSQTFPVENQNDAEQFIRYTKNLTADLLIIDLPPHTNEATEASLIICDLFLIPVTPSGADFVATSKAIALMQKTRAIRNGQPQCLLVPSRVDRRTSFGKEIADALQGFHEPISAGVGQRSAFVDCFGLGDWIGHAYPKSIAYQEIKVVGNQIEKVIYGSQ
jgi:chromosome partitioning protein